MTYRPPVALYASVIDPLLHPALQGFSCGGMNEFEREVDEIVDLFRTGHRPAQLQFLVGREPNSHSLVGLCAIHEREMPGVSPGAMYVGIIGISLPFRGRRLPDGTRIGDWLLHMSLTQLQSSWRVMPLVWALIDRANQPSIDMFERHGFAEIPNQGYALYVRPEGLAVPH